MQFKLHAEHSKDALVRLQLLVDPSFKTLEGSEEAVCTMLEAEMTGQINVEFNILIGVVFAVE